MEAFTLPYGGRHRQVEIRASFWRLVTYGSVGGGSPTVFMS